MSVSGDNMTREQRLYTKALAQADERIASLQKRIAELETALAQSNAEPQALRDAAENLLIAIGMGWDIEGCVENLRAALAQSDADQARIAPETCPHCFNEDDCDSVGVCRALAQSDAEPVALKARFEEWAFTRGHRNFTKSGGDYLLPEIQKDWLDFKASGPADYLPIGGAGNGA